MADPRIKGQEISIRVIQDGQVITELNSIAVFNDSVQFEIKEDGFLGEVTNRFDEVLNGYSGDFEYQPNTARHLELTQAIEERAKREVPNRVFNVVRTDFFANGQSAIITYSDVKWGPVPTGIGGRTEFVKVKMEFKCAERKIQINAIA